MRFSSRLAGIALALTVATQAFAWNDGGHMVIAAIAQKHLSAKAKAEIDRLLKLGTTAKATDFISSAPWADDIRNQRRETGTWHYIDLHFREDGKPSTNKPDAENAAWAIDKFTKVLADKSKPDEERAEALRFLIHFVGDIHQPLHGTARDTEEEPAGDKGGNTFKILPPAELVGNTYIPKNLHSLWDGGCGLFKGEKRPLTSEGLQAIESLADQIMKDNPEGPIHGVRDLDPMHWAEESRDEAIHVVYNLKEKTVPSAEYMAAGRKCTATRAALAGYRLAALLNQELK